MWGKYNYADSFDEKNRVENLPTHFSLAWNFAEPLNQG